MVKWGTTKFYIGAVPLRLSFKKKQKQTQKIPQSFKGKRESFCNLIMKTLDKWNHFILLHFCWNVTRNKNKWTDISYSLKYTYLTCQSFREWKMRENDVI